MRDHYDQIRFIAVNYSGLQGLREVPIGLFVASVSLWTIKHQGDLGLPILAALAAALLYWAIDRFYADTFGRIRQTAKVRSWEIMVAILSGILAWLAFWLDTAQKLPLSTLGILLATVIFEESWRSSGFVKGNLVRLYLENLILTCLIFILSLLGLTGLTWWERLGFPDQPLAILTIFGILLIPAGIWGHFRLLRILPASEAKSDENAF
jgi:hypothetical protein